MIVNPIEKALSRTCRGPRRRNSTFCLLSFFSFMLIQACYAEQPRRFKCIEFPGNLSYGTVAVGLTASKTRTIPACGRILVPANSVTFFTPNKTFFLNPSVASKLPADAFSVVTLRLFSMDDSEDGLANAALKAISHLTELIALNLDRAEITDAGLCSINQMKKLQTLSAALTRTNGSFLKACPDLKSLETLCLSTDAIDSRYLPCLKNYPKLRILNLGHTKMTDSGLKQIGMCKNLEILIIGANPEITDAGIKELKSLKRLQELDVRETAVTAKGMLALKGLPIHRLKISPSPAPVLDNKLLHDSFPGLDLVSTLEKPVDQDTAVIFGPYSRGREFNKLKP